jgi:hypothetical protein
MSNETEPGASADQTTDAIYDLIKTMNGDGETHDRTTVFTPPPERDTATDDSEPNSHAEAQLYDMGILRRVTPNQRRLLGCIACRLRIGTDQPGELRTGEIAKCNNLTYEPARLLLESLENAGLVEAEVKTVKGIGVNAPTRWFRFTAQADETGFTEALVPPEQCGLTNGKPVRAARPYRPRPPLGKLTNGDLNRETEAFLIAKKVFQNQSAGRRAVLGCLACQLNKGEDGVFGLQVSRCQGITHTTAGLVFADLEKRGILTKTYGELQRVLYRLSVRNELGRGVDRLLEVPPQCNLERTINTETET